MNVFEIKRSVIVSIFRNVSVAVDGIENESVRAGDVLAFIDVFRLIADDM